MDRLLTYDLTYEQTHSPELKSKLHTMKSDFLATYMAMQQLATRRHGIAVSAQSITDTVDSPVIVFASSGFD